MKTFKASKLKTHTAEVFAAAREDGAIIQQCRTNKEVIEEFVILPFKACHDKDEGEIVAYVNDGRHAIKPKVK